MLHLHQHIKPKYDAPKTWYNVRIRSFKPTVGGANICLINENNECVMHRIAPPIDRGICEFTFEGPDVGDVVSVIAAPETGSWGLAEITVQQKTFMYNDIIGGRDGDTELAALLTKPRQVITNEMKARWDLEYQQLKESILAGTLQLTVAGSAITTAAVGYEKGCAFAAGGALAVAYALLLQWEIDTIGSKTNASFAVVRLACIFGIAVALVSEYHDHIAKDNSLFILGLIGFMSHKASIFNLKRHN